MQAKVKAEYIVVSLSILKELLGSKMNYKAASSIQEIAELCEWVTINTIDPARLEKAKELGTLDEEKQQYIFPTVELQEEFQEFVKELLERDIVVSFNAIPLSLIDGYLTIEPSNTKYVNWFISPDE